MHRRYIMKYVCTFRYNPSLAPFRLNLLVASWTSLVKMAKKNYYGLRGVKLNIAIAIVAGTDFALFGYDQVRMQSSL